MTQPLPLSDDTGLRQEVLDWFVRRQREDWSVASESVFQEWMAEDPSHARAYTQWLAHWQALDQIPADTVARLRRGLARDKAGEQGADAALSGMTDGSASIGRRRFLMPAAAFASAAVVAGSAGLIAWNQWQSQPVFTQAFSTQRGQQVDVPLPDGSAVQLDTATRLEVRYYRQFREVRLLEGQAVFSVQADPARPLHVLAGPVGVTVVGTRFAVRHTPELPGSEGVQVAVQEGKVRVVRRDTTQADGLHRLPNAAYLMAGQQVLADAAGNLAATTDVPSEGIAPWREQRISFVNTPLAQALAELERYGSTGLTVRDPQVAQMRLSGTFDPHDTATLHRILVRALPVRLMPTSTGADVVAVH